MGIPTGLLQAGAAGVVSSLWTVDDQSTKFLMEKFYEDHIRLKLSPSEALNKAQKWLRDADQEEIGPLQPSGTRMDIPDYNQTINKIFESNRKYPFSHPYYWAAFTLTGA